MAFFDPAKLFDAQGNPIPLHELDQATRSVLTISYDVRPDGSTTLRVRMPNHQQALAVLEKRYAQFMEMQIELLHSFVDDDQVAGEEERQPAAPLPKTDLEVMNQQAALAQASVPQPEAAPAPQPMAADPQDPDYDFRKDPYWMFGGKKHFRQEQMQNPNPLFRLGAAEYKEREPEAKAMPGALLKGRIAGLVAPLFGR